MYIAPCTGNGSQESTHWVDSASTDDERRYPVDESWQVIIQKAQDDDKQNKTHNTIICVEHHDTQTYTYNVNKTWALLQISGG